MKSSIYLLALAATIGEVAAAVARKPSNNPIVDLGYVKYEGVYNATSGINSFFGINFAAPPTGNLRWQPPVNIESRNNFSSKGAPINASATGPACVQGNPAWQGMPPGGAGQSEDCLLLDVKVPANPTSKFLPVAIQIHGGGYATGNAAQVSAGDALIYQSKGNLIYVSIQYRLGAYGFLGGADVAAHGTLNAGLLDQRAAIEWVNRHIGAFGGDASRITITGGSAGAGSVMNQMIMYGGEANPPFQAALAEYPWWQPYHDSYVQERQYSVLLGQANCSDIVCLRSISEAALLQAYQTSYAVGYAAGQYGYGDYWYGPLVDGNIIRDLPSAEFLRGHFTKVPLLVDHEGYEGYGFTNKSLNTTAEGAADLATLWPNAGKSFFERLYQLYPSSAFNSTIFQVQQIFGDAFISCPTYYMSTAAVDHDVPVWKLNFRAGAETHGSTQAFIYSTSINPTGNNATIATTMRDYFISFFVHFDPNVETYSNVPHPYWNEYNTDNTFQVMDVNYTMIGMNPDQDASPQCDFLHSQGVAVRN